MKLDIFWQECAYSLRVLRRSPGFSFVAIFILALGIGSTLSVFILIDSLFLRTLPVDRPDELVRIISLDKQGFTKEMMSKVLDDLGNEPAFQGICAFLMPQLSTEINGSDESSAVLTMSGNCFAALKLRAQIGRTFTPSDDRLGTGKVALLTDGLWRTSFGKSRDVLGKTLKIGKDTFTIIGVMKPEFSGLIVGFPPSLIIPLQQTPLDFTPSGPQVYFWASLIARLAPGVSQSQAQSRITVLRKTMLEDSVPGRYNEAQKADYLARKVIVVPAKRGVDFLFAERFAKPLNTLLVICCVVLIIACVNLGTMLMARALKREHELGIRLILGAGKANLIRLLVVENAFLVIAGSLAGVFFAYWADHVLAAKAAETLQGFSVPENIDWHPVAFVFGLVLLVCAMFAVVPLWRISRLRGDPASLKSGTRVIGNNASKQKILLGIQFAFTLALIAIGSTFTSSLQHLYTMDLGFKMAGLSEATLLRQSGITRASQSGSDYPNLLRTVRTLPDVSNTCLSDFAPLWTKTYPEPVTATERIGLQSEIQAQNIAVSEDFFQTMGIPIIAGETFAGTDLVQNSPTVAIISESLAKLMGGEKVIGMHINIAENPAYQSMRVVGVAADAQLSLEDPEQRKPLIVYTNFWQHPERQRFSVLITRTYSGNPLPGPVLRHTVTSFGQHYVDQYDTLYQSRNDALVENRLLAYVSGGFSLLALILAATGLFGLLSYHVARRTSEIGIRMALGAERWQIRLLVAREIFVVLITGLAGGVILIFLARRVVSGIVYGTSIVDPKLLVLAILILGLTGIFGALVPAHRASSIDPITALRLE